MRILAAALTAAAILVPAPALPVTSETPVGLWQQFDDKKGGLRSIVRIDDEGDTLSARVVKTVPRPGEEGEARCERCPGDFKGQPIVGLRFMWGLKGAARHWDDGRVLDPEEGKIYRVKLTLSEDGRTLEVRGYIGFSLFGRTQMWKRADPASYAPGR